MKPAQVIASPTPSQAPAFLEHFHAPPGALPRSAG